MPRIPWIILNSIAYLYQDEDAASCGEELGASGFLMTMPSRAPLICATAKNANHIYAVTNAHVIEDGNAVMRINLKYESSGYERTRIFPFSQESWVVHPEHDLAVRPMPPDLDTHLLDIALLTIDRLADRADVNHDRIGHGDDLFYVGRFRDHAGKLENLPSVRFGNISMLPKPDEPIEYEVQNRRRRKQVGFLVEARSRSGYSGSPVFHFNEYIPRNQDLVTMDMVNIKILGVDWGHIPERVELRDPSGYLDGQRRFVEVHSGMMGVVPAWYLKEFLDTSPALIEQRRRDDEYYCTHPPVGVPDVQ